MITLRRSEERGYHRTTDHETYHSFSSSPCRDSDALGFRRLRALNDDRFSPGSALSIDAPDDVEVLSFVLDGRIETSGLGAGGELFPGDLLRERALGHDALSTSIGDRAHLVQIWLRANGPIRTNRSERRNFSADMRRDRLHLLASADGRDDSIPLQSDTDVWSGTLSPRQTLIHPLGADRDAWVQVVQGSVRINGALLTQGDGAALSGEDQIELCAAKDSEVLVLDMGA